MTNQHKHTLAFIAFITVLVSGQYFITDAFNTAMQLAGYYAVSFYIGKLVRETWPREGTDDAKG